MKTLKILHKSSPIIFNRLPGSMIETAGKVVFEDWGDNTTQVDIMITYHPLQVILVLPLQVCLKPLLLKL